VTLFLAGLGLILLGGIAAFVLRHRPDADAVFRSLVIAGCVACGVVAIGVLAGGDVPALTIPSGVPGGDWIISIDALSAVFLLTVVVAGGASAAFGTAYMAPERAHRPVWFAHAWVAILVVALALVVTAQSVIPFMIAWELMAIASFVLILTEHEDPSVRRGGFIYLITTHTATLALFAMFAVWGAHASDWSFAALGSGTPAATATLVLVLAVIGFGFKAGIVPFHFWLPPAHAAAPTHVSAMMSGVVIKTGIYGLLRVVSLLGAPPSWWGWLVLALGASSAVLGVLWALAQHDLKRLLAYHSVENIGIILMGLGVGALGAAYGNPLVSIVGYAGAILHTVNHALFKSLLFLGAGAVARATGTRDLEHLGGLARRMPRTWLAFLIGATAIIGVPPLNGFVSEWLVYQGLFRAGQAPEALRLASLGIPALGLTGALALACFAKVAGVVFLGHPRTREAAEAQDVGRGFTAPMLALAGLCVLLGTLVPLGVAPAFRSAAFVAGVPAGDAAGASRLVSGAAWIGGIAIALYVLTALGWLVRRNMLRQRAARVVDTWACGYGAPTTRMQYTASSFAAPLLSAFGGLSGSREERTARSFATHPLDLVLDRVVTPAWSIVRRAALRLRPMQQGRLHAYLMYVMVTLVALLVYMASGGRS
jgi:formate hydrogenlyase subunit 3/multisubunit Na+/H+ antiporter MnhD subunit